MQSRGVLAPLSRGDLRATESAGYPSRRYAGPTSDSCSYRAASWSAVRAPYRAPSGTSLGGTRRTSADGSLGIATLSGSQRTTKMTLVTDGMQGVRGSSPLSSTYDRQQVPAFADHAEMAHMPWVERAI